MMRLCDALFVPHGITAVVGGGGKTTLIAQIASELEIDAHVLLATTTHIRVPKEGYLQSPTPEALHAALQKGKAVTVGEPAPHGKLTRPNGDLLTLATVADYALIEADGSRGLPVKAPAEHEPVFTGTEGLVVAVAGMSAVGKPIAEAAHRPQLYATLVQKPLDALITPKDMAHVLMHPSGQKKDVTCRYAVVLNQCDDQRTLAAARACAKLLDCDCVLASLKSEPSLIELWRNGQCLWSSKGRGI